MFGRRRHVAQAPVAPAPQLGDDAIFDLVRRAITDFIGDRGEWSVVRRRADDSDTIFRDVLTHSVATDIVQALRDARAALESNGAEQPESASDASPTSPGAGAEGGRSRDAVAATETNAGEHVAAVDTDAADAVAEPAAFGWEPAPITVWADLRRPVTGEVPLPRRDMVA